MTRSRVFMAAAFALIAFLAGYFVRAGETAIAEVHGGTPISFTMTGDVSAAHGSLAHRLSDYNDPCDANQNCDIRINLAASSSATPSPEPCPSGYDPCFTFSGSQMTYDNGGQQTVYVSGTISHKAASMHKRK